MRFSLYTPMRPTIIRRWKKTAVPTIRNRRPDHHQVGIPVPLRTAAAVLIPVPAVETRHLQIQVAAAPVPEESHPAAVIRIPAERVLPAAAPIQAVRTHLVMTIHPVMRTHPVTSLRPAAKTHPVKGPLRAERPATIPVSPARTTSPDPVLRQSPARFCRRANLLRTLRICRRPLIPVPQHSKRQQNQDLTATQLQGLSTPTAQTRSAPHRRPADWVQKPAKTATPSSARSQRH